MDMKSAHKAFVMLSAAVTMTMLGTAAAEAGGKAPPSGKGKIKAKNKKTKRGKVKKVRRAKRRPSDFDPDLSMPAGTAYDVIQADDLL